MISKPNATKDDFKTVKKRGMDRKFWRENMEFPYAGCTTEEQREFVRWKVKKRWNVYRYGCYKDNLRLFRKWGMEEDYLELKGRKAADLEKLNKREVNDSGKWTYRWSYHPVTVDNIEKVEDIIEDQGIDYELRTQQEIHEYEEELECFESGYQAYTEFEKWYDKLQEGVSEKGFQIFRNVIKKSQELEEVDELDFYKELGGWTSERDWDEEMKRKWKFLQDRKVLDVWKKKEKLIEACVWKSNEIDNSNSLK